MLHDDENANINQKISRHLLFYINHASGKCIIDRSCTASFVYTDDRALLFERLSEAKSILGGIWIRKYFENECEKFSCDVRSKTNFNCRIDRARRGHPASPIHLDLLLLLCCLKAFNIT